MSAGTIAKVFPRVCVSREFTTMATGRTSPVAGWLRSLARSLHKEVAGPDLRVTTVTIDGVLSGPHALDVDEIADLYWRLHTGAVEAAPEVRFPS